MKLEALVELSPKRSVAGLMTSTDNEIQALMKLEASVELYLVQSTEGYPICEVMREYIVGRILPGNIH